MDAEGVLDDGNSTSFTQKRDNNKEAVIYCEYCGLWWGHHIHWLKVLVMLRHCFYS